MNEKIFIIAGNYSQARLAAKEKGLSMPEWVYLNRPDQLRGIAKGSARYMIIGTWPYLKNLKEIQLELKIRECIEVQIKNIQD